jgi:hypothetical protein
MGELKPLDQILKPDELSPAFLHSLETVHAIASSITLGDAVPENVNAQFDIARHAYVYAWCYYHFLPVAELYAILAVELALRMRYKASPPGQVSRANEPGLGKLLQIAADQGWITDAGFDAIFTEWVEVGEDLVEERQVPPERAPSVTKIVVEFLPKIRNDLAHGEFRVLSRTGNALQRAAEIINQLFPAPAQPTQKL